MVVVALLALCILLDLASIVSSLAQVDLLERMQFGDYTMAEADANDARQGALGIAWLVAFIVTAIAFITWTYRAYHNAGVFGGERSMGQGWAIGGWFVPFLNWFRPYKVLREAWVSTAFRTHSEPVVDPPFYFPLWWGLWVVDNLLGNLVFRLEQSSDLDTLIFHTWLFIASDVASIAAGALAIVVVQQLTRRQTEAASTVGDRNLSEVFS